MTPEERALLLTVAKWVLALETIETNGYADDRDRAKLAELRDLIGRVEAAKQPTPAQEAAGGGAGSAGGQGSRSSEGPISLMNACDRPYHLLDFCRAIRRVAARSGAASALFRGVVRQIALKTGGDGCQDAATATQAVLPH
jgi:hypothetical protein